MRLFKSKKTIQIEPNELFSGKIDHSGISVPDIEQAVTFFTEVLHFEVIKRIPQMRGPVSGMLTKCMGVYENTKMVGSAFLRYGGDEIELVQWSNEDQQTKIPNPADVNAAHLAISVSDVKEAMEYFKNVPGVTVRDFCPAGFFYIRTPWGYEIQIMSKDVHK